MDKSKTLEELVKEIQESEPDYKPEVVSNVVRIRPIPSINNIVPIKFNELMAETPPKIEFIAEPIIPVQGICFIYAATGLGKTLFTLNLSYAIAQGGSFLKYQCPMPRKVLYIDGEMSFSDLYSRLMTILKNHGELDFPENFSVITPDKVHPMRVPKIDEEIGQVFYEELIKKENFEVIVFDNISMLTSIDENKSEEWKSIQDWFLYLRSLGKTVIVIHHAGKDKMGYRGSSRMLDCANTAISLQPIQEEGLEEESVSAKKFNVVYHKHRSFGGKDALSYEVILERGIWSYRSMEETKVDQIVERVKAGMSQRDIAKELLISQTTVNRLINKARRDNRIS